MPALAQAAGALTLLALAAGPAQATGTPSEKGTAQASVLTAGLDVSLLNKTLNVPVKTSLNEVTAPGTASRTALTVTVDGVDKGQPVSMLRADVATAKADVRAERAEAHAELARAKVHVPGLPLLSLIEVENVTSRSVCVAGARPEAEANALGRVTVLGKRVTLTAGGPTRVRVPAVGEVTLTLSKTHTTTRKAAAAALELKVSVNPLKLNVAEVEGLVTLASTACTVPDVQTLKQPAPAAPRPQTVTADPVNLAETGGSSATPYLVGGGVLLLAVGGVAVARGRRA
ncbi:LPXTG cell wall anchor domain-containing protein [Streptomyces spiroverticillatus]|uniref:LPXTG cell wall anchor domain-containing protein n=1 Tax=Streptomyces finlayi TaxID=67296 RepID=A0A919CAA7_9ACTN|nr:SCO1860 family LAETG-anchored protein [Streptomyces finlayi]GGZ91451.1 LPXTG cell wall anchor domain-containing protein [Streptomyces spiroverticillatus]GHC93784.1 LPXTG cell wall anchor domain-containing protein [Streptomyces finlayi]